MAYGTPNIGAVTISFTFLTFFVKWILNIKKTAYWLLLILYSGYAYYTYWFHINKGVEVIRSIQPLWRGTPSGKLWPEIFYYMGLIDEEENLQWFDYEDIINNIYGDDED